MHTNQPTTHKRATLIAAVIVVLLTLAIGAAFYYSFSVVSEAVPT